MHMEKLGKLRIFIYGKYALNDFQNICSNSDMKIYEHEEKNIKYNFITNSESSWEYLVFSGEINKQRNEVIKSLLEEHFKSENSVEMNNNIKRIVKKYEKDKTNDSLNKELKKLLNENRHFFDVLVISVDNLLDEDSKSAFDFFQGFSQVRAQQPFIIFLTKKDKNPNILTLHEFITNEFFDKRNVYAYKFPENNQEKENINKFFIDAMNYYHEIGTGSNGEQLQTFNILICGGAGVGKSTFINQFLQEKRAKEGEGLSVTHEITNYLHSKYPIKIFDTPGFEGSDTIAMVRKTIEQFDKDICEAKNHFDLILYVCKLQDRTFLELEIPLLIYLIKSNKKMIFILNNHGNTRSECKKMLEVTKSSLKQIVKAENDKIKESKAENDEIKESRLDELVKNMVIINLKQKIEDDDDEEEEKKKRKIKQSYGMDDLFNKIYELFKGDKIVTHEIEGAKDVKEIMKVLDKYKLLSYIKSIEDIGVNLKIELSKTILSYAKYDKFIWFFRDSRRKDLLNIINNKMNGKNIEDIEECYSIIENKIKKMSRDDKKGLIIDFFESIKRYKGIFNTEGFSFDVWFYNEYTLLVCYLYLKGCEKEYGQYDEKSKKFLTQLSDSFNKAIEGFLELSNEWKNVYKSLKSHKSDKEWVHKYFFVEVPKVN